MAIVIRETDHELGAEEKMITLNILLVIYLHDKRYLDALADIEELLIDPKMDQHREYLLLKQNEVRQILASLLNKRRTGFLQRILGLFNNPTL